MRRFALLPSVLFAATAVAVFLVLGIARENVRQIQTLRDDSSAVAHTLEVQQHLDAVLLAASEAERNQIAYLLTDADAYLTEYNVTVDRLRAALQRLETLTTDDAGQARRVQRLSDAADRRLFQLSEGIQTRQARGREAAASVMSDVTRPILLELRAIAAEMAATEASLLSERRERAENAYRSAVGGRLGSGLVTSFLLVSLAVFAAARARARDKTTQIIAREREHLEVTLSSIGDAVVATDVDGRVTLMNPVAASLTGWTPEEAIGRPIAEICTILSEETREPVVDPATRLLSGREVRSIDHTVLVARGGGEHPVDVSGASIRAADGRFRGAVLVFRDVTARRAHEQALRESEQRYRDAAQREEVARREAETANRLKDEFLAMLSHELRTPLNAVTGWAQILLSKAPEDQTFARGLASIKRNADAQRRLVEDLLDVSRIVTGKFPLETKSIDLRAPVGMAVEAVRPATTEKGITLRVELNGPVTVVADPDRIQQAAANLLSNAVKFTPADGRIDVSLSRSGGGVQFSVSDTGEGVAPDLLPYIFDRFRQGDGSTTRAHGGLGLGLAIVKHIVEAHGGTIAAHSDGKGQGAKFIVRLAVSETPQEPARQMISEGAS